MAETGVLDDRWRLAAERGDWLEAAKLAALNQAVSANTALTCATIALADAPTETAVADRLPLSVTQHARCVSHGIDCACFRTCPCWIGDTAKCDGGPAAVAKQKLRIASRSSLAFEPATPRGRAEKALRIPDLEWAHDLVHGLARDVLRLLDLPRIRTPNGIPDGWQVSIDEDGVPTLERRRG